MSEELMSEETLRATVRQLVEGITYASYYRSGKAQVTLERSGREALVRLLAMVSLEDDVKCHRCGDTGYASADVAIGLPVTCPAGCVPKP